MFVECACQKWNQNSSYSCSTRCIAALRASRVGLRYTGLTLILLLDSILITKRVCLIDPDWVASAACLSLSLRPRWGLVGWELPGEVRMEKEEDRQVALWKKWLKFYFFGGEGRGGGSYKNSSSLIFTMLWTFCLFWFVSVPMELTHLGHCPHYIPQLQLHQNPQKSCHRLKMPQIKSRFNFFIIIINILIWERKERMGRTYSEFIWSNFGWAFCY